MEYLNSLSDEMILMKNDILNNLSNPGQIERLYRNNKRNFRNTFNLIYPEIQDSAIAQVWHERLNYETDDISWGSSTDFKFVILISVIAGLIAKIPDFLSLSYEFYYPRNFGFILFPMLAVFFIRKNKLPINKIVIVAGSILISMIYINLLPDDEKSDSLILACMHLPLFLWVLLGFSFIGGKINEYKMRLEYLRYNGDLLIMSGLILIAGGFLTGITIGLFEMIDLHIEDLYFQYFGIWGLAATPIIATYLVRTNPQLVSKISPIIARVFTPLVLVMLVIYFFTIIFTGKDPYNDRDFLLIFNILLIGVMAIIIFSIAEISREMNNKIGVVILSALSVVTVIINGIALSAILFRINEWGITPNRLAVLGGNLLILANLVLVTFSLVKTIKHRDEIVNVEKYIAVFLPVYGLWAIVVTFIFPVLFGFK